MIQLMLIAAGLSAAWIGGWFGKPIPPRGQPELRDDAYRPAWSVGDRWIVETQSTPVQARHEAGTPGQPIRWRFEVKAREKLGGQECLRVEVRCPDIAAGPITTFWADARSLALRQIQTELTVRGKSHVITENYQFAGGQPAPVLAPLSALPLDMPLLMGGRAKGVQKFTFEAIVGPIGQKAVGDVGFAFEVEQRTEPLDANRVKNLVADGPRKQGNGRPVLEVNLESASRPTVRQLWQSGQPWPVFCDNGVTTARLISVEQAADRKEKP